MMPITVETDYRKNTKSGRLGHRRITIPVEIREHFKVEKGDFVEWELDTTKQTLIGRFIKNDIPEKKKGWFPDDIKSKQNKKEN